jgi:bla regulator protein BlaR1
MSLPILAALSAATVLVLFLKATLILTGVWVLVRMASRASAAVRHEVWMLGLLTTLCLPAAQVLLPPIGVDLPIPSRLTPTEQVARGVTSVEGGAIGDGASRSWLEGGWTGAETNPDVARRAEGARWWGWGELLLGVWFAGVALRLMSLAISAIRTRRLRYSARPTSRRSTRFAAEIAELLGVGRRVEVCESSLVPMPLTWGVMRPVVVLPRGVDDWPDERLRAVLLHEVAHVRRCD